MKQLKILLNYFIFFIIGNVIFNTIYSIVKVFMINAIGGSERYSSNLILSFRETIIIYLIIYLFLIIIDIIKKRTTINRLNEKLKDMKKRGEKNEK